MNPIFPTHRFQRILVSIALVIFSTKTATAGENWPQFRGPDGSGYSDAKDLPVTWSESENVRWKTPIHDRGWSSPVVWADQIWLTTATEDGKQMFALAINGQTGRIVHDLNLFDNAAPDDTRVYNSYASPTPVIEEGRVYLSFGSYGTACLNTKTGKTLWQRRDLPCNHYRGPGSSPILLGDLLIMHFDGYDYQYAIALNKTTGETAWKTDRQIDYGTTDGDIMKAFSTPTITSASGRLQMISNCSKAIVAYDPRDGKELWRVRHEAYSTTSRPVVAGDLALVCTGFNKGELLAIRLDGSGDVTGSHIAWRTARNPSAKPSPVLDGDRVVTVSDGGVAASWEVANGKEVWTKRLGGNYSASPIIADGRIYFFNQEGTATVIRAGVKPEQLAANTLDDGFMASPAVVGKSLILRTTKNLYRIEKQ